jgi:integrase
LVAEGRDPLEEKRGRRPREDLLSFRRVAEFYVAAHEAGWKSPKHRQQWAQTLEDYVYPVLGDLPVRDIGDGEVERVLTPIWQQKPETGSRVRGRIEAILDFAKAKSWRAGDNPARWKGHIEHTVPKRHTLKPTVHHPAVPWKEMPLFWDELAAREDMPALALRFAILTATRTNETRGARWDEIDLEAKVWTIPPSRMKGGREHRVPLTVAVIEMLEQLRAADRGAYVFPGARLGRPIGTNAMALVLRSLRPEVTVHGFRSSFRDWAAEAGINRELAECCLAHVVEGKVERAYLRSDVLEPRRVTMQRWVSYLTTPVAEPVVVPLRGRVMG